VMKGGGADVLVVNRPNFKTELCLCGT